MSFLFVLESPQAHANCIHCMIKLSFGIDEDFKGAEASEKSDTEGQVQATPDYSHLVTEVHNHPLAQSQVLFPVWLAVKFVSQN